MTRKRRLIFLGLSLILLIVIGYLATGSFAFLLQQFWFTAGLFLLILLSLVDQPHFSKDANVFQNGITAWVALLLVPQESHDAIWWTFFAWAVYLVSSSYLLMWLRSRELHRETASIQLVSRLNRQIGRPEALFSALFLWGLFLQFRAPTRGLNALVLFWAVFMIINLPAVSQALEELFTRRSTTLPTAGVILRLISPRVAEAKLSAELPFKIVGRQLQISKDRTILGDAVIIDDRFVAGQRIGRLAVTTMDERWGAVSNDSTGAISLTLIDPGGITQPVEIPVSVADVGSEIGKLVFYAHPDLDLQSGEVVWTKVGSRTKAFYQIVSGQVFQVNVVKVTIFSRLRFPLANLGSGMLKLAGLNR